MQSLNRQNAWGEPLWTELMVGDDTNAIQNLHKDLDFIVFLHNRMQVRIFVKKINNTNSNIQLYIVQYVLTNSH